MMKKLSLFIVMLVAMTIGVKAQGHFVLPTIGYNLSDVAVSNCTLEIPGLIDLDAKDYLISRLGFSAGLNYRYEFRKPFIVEAGIYYNNYGYGMKDIKQMGTKILWNYDLRISHFSVPVMFGYKFVIGKSKKFSITPKVGLQFGSYLKVYEKYKYLTMMGEGEYDESYSFDDGFDVAEMVGVDFSWRLNEILDIFVNVNNRFSFKNIVENDYNDAKMFNYTFGANVGVKVNVGK